MKSENWQVESEMLEVKIKSEKWTVESEKLKVQNEKWQVKMIS